MNPTAFILYNISAFLRGFAITFLVQALWHLYKQLKISRIIIISLAYILIIVLIMIIPNGIRYDQTTNWSPKYSWEFLAGFYVYIIIGGVIPSTFLLLKLLQKLESKKLIKRIKIYFIGEIFYYIASLGVALLNILDSQIYEIIWSFISLFLTLLLTWFLYPGLGREFSIH